jgi:hypothetical protein
MEKEIKCYCNNCNKMILFEDLNPLEREEFLNNNYCFVCSKCINEDLYLEDMKGGYKE